jgi:hypothetical protein
VPVIPYPNAVRALHQVNRHGIERGAGHHEPPGLLTVSEALKSLGVTSPRLETWAQRIREAKTLLPSPRKPSDG